MFVCSIDKETGSLSKSNINKEDKKTERKRDREKKKFSHNNN